MKPPPPPKFLGTFDASILERFVDAIRTAYNNARRLHDPDCGSNEPTFGTSVYHFCVHELCKRAKDDARIEVLSRAPRFRLKVGDYEIACHRVGRHGTEDIYDSFPKNEGAVHKMAPQVEQLYLDFSDWVGEPMTSLDGATKLVLAHLGNPDDGVQAIYLCFPGTIEGRRIKSWNYAHLVWKSPEIIAASTNAEAPANDVSETVTASSNEVREPAPKSERAADENVEKATVKRRSKKGRNEEGSE